MEDAFQCTVAAFVYASLQYFTRLGILRLDYWAPQEVSEFVCGTNVVVLNKLKWRSRQDVDPEEQKCRTSNENLTIIHDWKSFIFASNKLQMVILNFSADSQENAKFLFQTP